MLRKSGWLAAGAALALLCAHAFAQGGSGPASAYERLDESRLAARLKDLQMAELLDALLKQSSSVERLEGLYLRSQAKIAAARSAKAEARRNALLDEAIAIQDQLVDQTTSAKGADELLRHYRYTLDRIVTEGITKTHGYVERLEYFLARPEDAGEVDKLTKSALGLLNRLLGRAEMTRDDWAGDDEQLVTGNIWRLEELLKEANYRGAWIRLYRGVVLPRNDPERGMLLHRAIEAVAEFANADDNTSGVKFTALLLSGMAARELGEWHNTAAFLKRAADKEAGPLRLKAMFEMARSLIEQKQFAQAKKFIEQDFAAVGREAASQVAVDMQSSLLMSHMLDLQARAIKPVNPHKADQLVEQSIQVLLDFIDKRPEYREAFMEVIAPKFEGRDAKGQPPAIQVALGIWYFNKKTPEDGARAAELFGTVRRNKGAGETVHATALWYLGLISNSQRRNREAALFFGELAGSHPRDRRAKDAAFYALRSLNGILKEKKAEPHQLGKEFVEQYAGVLKVLTDGWANVDPEVRLKYYDLGIQYETLGRTSEAIQAFSKVPSDSELYVPSRYRILDLRVQELLDAPLPGSAKRQLASSLITELSEYRRRAGKFEGDPGRVEQVRNWAARCQMLEAQLHKDVLDEPDRAIEVARRAAKDWPTVPDIEAVTQEFVVRVLLETGKTEDAMKILETFRGAEVLLAEMVNQIRTRIDRRELDTDPQAQQELEKYRQAYRVFANRLHKFALDKKLSAQQMYPFEQALAGAFEFSAEDAAKALALYEKLDRARPNEAINIRGLARCYRRLGRNKEAMEYYDRLIEGLPEGSAAWWRAQLERLRFFLQTHVGDAEGLKDALVHVRQLRRYKGSQLGGFHRQFGAIEGEVNDLLKSLAPPASPGGTPPPASL